MDNSLIAGMPEVIAYIKKIEEENKALKEEKAPLFLYKAKVKELRDEIEEIKEQKVSKCFYKLLEEQNEKLKKVVQQRAFRIIELENDLETTTNYWKSKYENEVDTNKMLMEAIEANSTD